MLTPTHALTAGALYLSFGGTSPTGALVAIAAAIAPDLDTRQSFAGKALPIIAGPIEHHFGHRTVTHSLLLQLVVCTLAYLLLPGQFALAITCGLVSHAILDMLTKSGVCWFWPSRVRCVLPGSSHYRFEVGGWGELIFAIGMAAMAFGAVHLHKSTAGTGGMIRAAIGDIGAARRQYDEEKGSHAFILRVSGRDNASFAKVAGEYPVIAGWASNGLLVDDGGTARTVCQGECDWYPERAVLVATGEQQTTVRQLEVPQITIEALRAAVEPLEGVGRVYLTGMVAGKIEAKPPVVQEAKRKRRLYYATVADLPESGALRDVALTIQVRHAPGMVVPVLAAAGDAVSEASGIDPLLERWLE